MAPEENMLTTEDVANYLKVDVVTVRRLVSRGQLAAYRIGAEYRFTLTDLQDYLKRQYVPVGPVTGIQDDSPFRPYFLLHEIYGRITQGRPRAKRAAGQHFTERAKAALAQAQAEAERQRCGHIYASHLLLALAAEPGGLAERALEDLGVTSELIRDALAHHPQLTGPAREPSSTLALDPEVKRALEAAVQQAKKQSNNTIGTEHLLLGLLAGPDNKALAVIQQLNVDADSLRARVAELNQPAGN